MKTLTLVLLPIVFLIVFFFWRSYRLRADDYPRLWKDPDGQLMKKLLEYSEQIAMYQLDIKGESLSPISSRENATIRALQNFERVICIQNIVLVSIYPAARARMIDVMGIEAFNRMKMIYPKLAERFATQGHTSPETALENLMIIRTNGRENRLFAAITYFDQIQERKNSKLVTQ